jgi:hypothetical protein
VCSRRILKRLGISGGKHQKQSITALLSQLHRQLKRGRNKLETQFPTLADALTNYRFLQGLVDRLLHDPPSRAELAKVREVVDAVWRLSQTINLPEIIAAVPVSPEFTEEEKKRLLNLFLKVASYHSASLYLYKETQKLDALRNARVESIDLSDDIFKRGPADSVGSTLSSCLSRFIQPSGSNAGLDTICQYLNMKPSQAKGKFRQWFSSASEDAKIHAEIQIVTWYDLHPSPHPPRVISSSKDACFLCNEFIRLHGQYHVPGSHGRLYPAWRWPNIDGHEEIQARLNNVVEEKIVGIVRELHSTRIRIKLTCPNESRILELPLSSVCLLDTGGESVNAANLEIVLEEEQFKEAQEEVQGDVQESDGTRPAASTSSTTPSTMSLVQEHSLSRTILPQKKPHQYKLGPLSIHLEYSVGENWRGSPSLRCKVEWLGHEEANQVRQEAERNIFDAMRLGTSDETTSEDKRLLHISHGGHIIRVTLE